MTPDDALAALREQKVVVIRHLLSADTVRAVADRAAETYAVRDQMAAQGRLPDALRMQHSRRTIALDVVSPDRAVIASVLENPTIQAIALAYLGKPPTPLAETFVRSVLPARADAHLPFHQDETICGHRLLNVWIACSRCGEDAPGLELVRFNEELLTPIGAADDPIPVERARVDGAAVLARFGAGALWRPVFDPGDAAVFYGTTIHRTYSTATMRSPRLSAEIRLA